MKLRLLLEGAMLASLGHLSLVQSHLRRDSKVSEYNILWNDGEDHLHIPRKLEEECSVDNLEKFPDGVVPKEVVSFMGMGDTPYFPQDRFCLNHQLRTIENMKGGGPAFMIHIGDIKSGKPQYPCTRASYQNVAEMFSHPNNARNYNPRDVLFVPGDNEWSDCEDKDEAWDLWMEHFGPGNRYGFGELTSGVTVERHTDTFRKPGVDRSENFAFFLNDVLFIGINMVGGVPPDDEAKRLQQNLEWIERKFAQYSKKMKAAVIFSHAQVLDGSRGKFFGRPLENVVNRYPDIPILFLHGNGHLFCTSTPYANATNFLDVEVDDGDSAPPIKVSLLEHNGKHLFSIDRGEGTYRSKGQKCPQVIEETWTTPDSDASATPTPTPDVLPPPKMTKPPTPMPTVVLPPPKPELEYLQNPPPNYFPLDECQGRCTKNSDCQQGLVCKQVDDGPVEGCAGVAVGGTNLCVHDYNPPSPKPKLQYVTTKKSVNVYPLGMCQGDCDDDKHCAEGLYCRERRKGQPVAECDGVPKGSKDYCVPNPENTLLIVGNGGDPAHHWPLGMCKGDCDTDVDCGPGLSCFKRKRFTPVPGCHGLGEKGKDYCYKKEATDPAPVPTLQPPPELPVLKWVGKYPGPQFPLAACEADCDEDSHCQKGLYCLQRRKGDPISACSGKPKGGSDYCVPIPYLYEGSKKPFGRCEGHCERARDCEAGLKCKKRSGSQSVPGCKGSGVSGRNYCFDPATNVNDA